jgi:chitin synthase
MSTNSRRIWLVITEVMTCVIPDFVLSKDANKNQAWREKVTLFMLIFLSSSSIIFIIGILPKLICLTDTSSYSWKEIWKSGDAWVVVNGKVYDVKDKIAIQDETIIFSSYLGQDVSSMFYRDEPDRLTILEYNNTKETLYLQNESDGCNKNGDIFQDTNLGNSIVCKNINTLGTPIGTLSLSFQDLSKNSSKNWFYIYNNVYDVTEYISKGEKFGRCLIEDSNLFDNIEWCHSNYKDLPYVNENCGSVCVRNKQCYETVNNALFCNSTLALNGSDIKTLESDSFYLDSRLNKVLTNKPKLNATIYFENIFKDLSEQERKEIIEYMDKMFFIGIIETNFVVFCYVVDLTFFIVMIIIASIIVLKFLSALFILAKQYPEEKNKYVIINMPIYTENLDEIQKSIFAVADMEYSDFSKKLLFIVSDGIITGKGNDKPSCEIALNILGRTLEEEEEYFEYESLGDGILFSNCTRVFTGIYRNEYNNLPYMVVVKTGNSTEKNSSRRGNRGKRDSQLILFDFLSNVFYNNELNTLHTKFFTDIENIIGCSPHDYEYMMCIDCDTEPAKDSLKQLVYKMTSDSKIIGLCGETRISNKTDSWITAIQVYEYYINHNLTKAFESLFGNVTCLPGCFTMYRIKSVGRKVKPFVIHKDILAEYSIRNVDTLHMKNLLYLGEDRYLSTLLTKNFPKNSLKYMIEATCKTIAPDTWTVLLSQRRRWVNSTFHNLIELIMVKNMCGVGCFSMRFIIVLDFIATIFLPASVLFLYYLVYVYATGEIEMELLMIVILSIVYLTPVLVFLIKRQPEFFMWYAIYLVAMPIFTIIIPVYSFWKFDDFSWGKTREFVVNTEISNKSTIGITIEE